MSCRVGVELRAIIDRRSRPRGGRPHGGELDPPGSPRGARRRILLAHPSAQLYGSDRMALESATAFVEAGWDVLVVVDSDGPLRPALESAGARVAVVPMPVLRKKLMSVPGALRFAAQMIGAARRLGGVIREFRPDVMYVNTVTIPLWLLLGRTHRCHVVCHVHEAEEGLARVVRVALTAPLTLAHLVIANSGVTKDLLVSDLPWLSERVVVVHNGVPGLPRRPLPGRLWSNRSAWSRSAASRPGRGRSLRSRLSVSCGSEESPRS